MVDLAPSPAPAPAPAADAAGTRVPVLDVVIPVYNEERVLERSVHRLRSYLDAEVPWPSVVTIVDNASTDATAAIADYLAARLAGVRVRHLPHKGRGLALRTAWSESDAAVVAYMDVDLSTSLTALLPLVAPLVSGHSDIAIGSRLARGARVLRGPRREVISRAYNLVLRACLHNGFSDAQCGFKAVRADVARRLLPEVVDNAWFFDTELLIVAERRGLRIHEVPVDWVDDPDSRVDIVRTAADDLRGVARLARRWHGPADPAVPAGAVTRWWAVTSVYAKFARVGLASTVAYVALFFGLRGPLGELGANAVALGLCTVANALANAMSTFAGRRPLATSRLVLAGAVAFATSLALTSAGLALTTATGVGASVPVLAAVLVGANAVAAFGRFVLLHAWMFRQVATGDSTLKETK